MYIPELATQNNADKHDQGPHQHKEHQCLIFYNEGLVVGNVWKYSVSRVLSGFLSYPRIRLVVRWWDFVLGLFAFAL